MWIALLLVAGLLIGGVITFARRRAWLPAIVLGAAAVLAFLGALAWVPRVEG